MEFELKQGEVIEKEIQGEHWFNFFSDICVGHMRGVYAFTNERILFKGQDSSTFEIPYVQIKMIKKWPIGVLPTGISVVMKDGKKYFLDVFKRKETMELIQSKI